MKKKLVPYLMVWTTRDDQLFRCTGGAIWEYANAQFKFIWIKIIAFWMYYKTLFEHLWFIRKNQAEAVIRHIQGTPCPERWGWDSRKNKKSANNLKSFSFTNPLHLLIRWRNHFIAVLHMNYKSYIYFRGFYFVQTWWRVIGYET